MQFLIIDRCGMTSVHWEEADGIFRRVFISTTSGRQRLKLISAP
jgi:uncharacterized linocin/CFP29 family protein